MNIKSHSAIHILISSLILVLILTGCQASTLNPTAAPALEPAAFAAVGDFVWDDSNQNGLQDSDEIGLPNVTVTLYDRGNLLTATTLTDAGGRYAFTALEPGKGYYIVFTAPSGYTFSPQDQGSDEQVDSDANPTSGQTDLFTLGDGEINLNMDAGIWTSSGVPDGEDDGGDDDDSDGTPTTPVLQGKWIRVDAVVGVGANDAPFEILGTELEFNEPEAWMIESTAAYYLEGAADGWSCSLAGAYSANITPAYDAAPLAGSDASGVVAYTPGNSLEAWSNQCAYTAPADTIPAVDNADLIDPATINASTIHIPVIATPYMNFAFIITNAGNTLTVTITIPSDIGEVSRTYTYDRIP